MRDMDQVTSRQEPRCIAKSPEMLRLLDLVTRAAESEATILIQGETGTGKELIARMIHDRSPRHAGPFVPVNCGAYTDSLLASELFGHTRGAFTGAVADRPGVFEAAAGGTVLLDEIGAMSPAMQVKLLRVLQERLVTRVGSSLERPVDVRVVAATNADLTEMVRAGNFREDLYYRIKVITCRIPPLRERRDDIEPLIQHFLERFSQAAGKHGIRLSHEATQTLMHHPWPGNVRQLRAEVEQIVAMAVSDSLIVPAHLSPDLGADSTTRPPPETSDSVAGPIVQTGPSMDPEATYQEMLDAWTRTVVADRLARFGGNITRTAQSLDISRSTMYALLKKYGMHGQDA